MNTNTTPPQWMLSVTLGRLDHRVLDQNTYWVTREATILTLAQMSTEHLRNVASMLEDMALELHLDAMARLILEPGRVEDLAAEILTQHLTGSSIATVSARDWLNTTALMTGIDGELRSRDAARSG